MELPSSAIDSPTSTSIDLASKLKGLRQERGLSLADVARQTDLSASFISLIENGKSDITFSRLYRLMKFYGAGLEELEPSAHSAPSVVRAGEEPRIYSPAEGIEIRLLAPDTARLMMPVIAVYQPGAELAEHTAHDGEDFIHVIRGRFLLEIEGVDAVILDEGDSAYYSATTPHRQRNLSSTPSMFFGVISPPSLMS